MRHAQPALLLPPPALPGKHQCLEPEQCCQKKVMVLSEMSPWLPSDQPLSTGKPNMHHIPVLVVQKSDMHLACWWGCHKNSALTFSNVQGYGLGATSIWSKPCPRQGHHRSWPHRYWNRPTGGSRAAAQRCWWTLHQPPW